MTLLRIMTFGGFATMKKTKTNGFRFLVVGICLFLLEASPALPDQIIIKSFDQFEFAHTCMERGEYGRAVGEFERFIHFFPEDPQAPIARYFIGVCHLKDRRFDAARETFSEIMVRDPDRPLAGKALFLTGESFYQQGASKEAEYYFGQVVGEYPFPDLKNAAVYRLGWTKIQGKSWQDASKAFSEVGRESVFFGSSHQLAEQSLKGMALPYKSPELAGILAALVPGLGHTYVSRYKDATVAFVLNGLFVWAAAESFHQDHEVLGGILTFLELGWYTGNIYSAVNVTHKHNRKLQDDFSGSLEDQFDLDLLTARKGRAGLSLTFQF
jgi:TolA-binding protein